MDNYTAGAGYYFSSSFDSGNLAKVELVNLIEVALPSENGFNVEFNLWTKPDCAGTEYENLNRSWFMFSIYGGLPFKVCKLNIVNMNKQAKLFSQGMRPVVRIGDAGKWELTKENPTYYVENENFTLSFLHKPGDNVDVKYYYAFTFPFTYTDCQMQLDRFDVQYRKTTTDFNYIINRLQPDNDNRKDIENNDIIHQTNDKNDENKSSSTTATDKKSSSTIEQQSNDTMAHNDDIQLNNDLAKLTKKELENEIYYHRELLIRSVEGRRIDLLTITNFSGIQNEREERLPNLFPINEQLRSNKFKGKKIIFVSSRVHPGETPASFVLNGLLKLLFDKKSTVACTLRRMYVFKIVPFLNPDGVFNGCYRSDTLGHNLNRVYLSPRIDTQPSIYAVRKLIRYYHNDKDIEEESEPPVASDVNQNKQSFSIVTVNDFIENQLSSNDTHKIFKASDIYIDSSSSQTDSSSRRNSSESEISENNDKTKSPAMENTDEPFKCAIVPDNTNISTPAASTNKDRNIGTVFHEKFMTEIKPIIGETQAPLLNQFKKPFGLKKDVSANNRQISVPLTVRRTAETTAETIKKRVVDQLVKQSKQQHLLSVPSPVPPRKEFTCRNRAPSANVIGSYRMAKQQRKDASSCNGGLITPTTTATVQNSNNNPLMSCDFTQQSIDNDNGICDRSNMFLYIDMHGHASKKGVFMYGNHLPTLSEAVECMLLPRLMSMNSHHFHFDACVFSERNMYHKGKRDGLSKEGSGRVAIYKAIGLIKSYTLEGNYNTGKYVNVLPPRGKDGHVRKLNLSAPKYTPAIFEEVGRALGPSILDLTNSNPVSRLINSEFKSLQGLRNSLRCEIDKTQHAQRLAHSKVSCLRSKRIKSATPTCCSSMPSADVLKENKGHKTHLNKHITTNNIASIFGKKDPANSTAGCSSSSIRKKGKVLCDVVATTTSSTTTTTATPTIKFTDQCIIPVPPTKRPKVATTKKLGVLDVATTSSLGIKDDFGGTNNRFANDNTINVINRSSSSAHSSTDLPGCHEIIHKFNDNIDNSDGNKPCCSTSITRNMFQKTVGKKANHFAGTTSSSTSLSTATATASVAPIFHAKKTSTKVRLKFSGVGGNTLLKQLKRGGGSLNKDAIKLKKKKILKSDVNTKRKKTKVF